VSRWAPAQVTPFSRWERELPKLLTDARFTAVPTLRERRALFDDFCKNVASKKSALRESEAQKAAAAEAGFAALLDEAAASERPAVTNGACVLAHPINGPSCTPRRRPGRASASIDARGTCVFAAMGRMFLCLTALSAACVEQEGTHGSLCCDAAMAHWTTALAHARWRSRVR
jgi:FF domain